MAQTAPAISPFAQRWQALAPRERAGVVAAAAALALALLWMAGIAPAWKTLAGAAPQHAALDAQLDTMQRLALQAKAVQAAPKVSLAEATRALEQATAALGATAELRVQGDRATLRLRAAPGEALARLLPLARELARAIPSELKLTRTATAASAPAAAWSWDGTIVFTLHAQ
jgi:general secretion pathway protein M